MFSLSLCVSGYRSLSVPHYLHPHDNDDAL